MVESVACSGDEVWGRPYITSHEFHDLFTPPPSLSQVVTFLRPLPSVTSHILQFYT